MPPQLALNSSYEKKKCKNYFEAIIEELNVHYIEDFLRHRLIERPYKLSKFETLLFARILWGRNLNAINVNKGQLDLAHLKAEVINMSCLVIHIRRDKAYLTSDLYKLLIHHTSIIREHLKFIKNIKLKHNYDIKHYRYCVEWFENCIIILDNKISDQKYILHKIEELLNEIKKKNIITINIDYDVSKKCTFNISVDDFL